jgi:hypothetical protein
MSTNEHQNPPNHKSNQYIVLNIIEIKVSMRWLTENIFELPIKQKADPGGRAV